MYVFSLSGLPHLAKLNKSFTFREKRIKGVLGVGVYKGLRLQFRATYYSDSETNPAIQITTPAVERMMQAVEKPELADLLAYYRESNVDVSSAHWVEDVLTPDMMKAREIQQRIIAIKNKYRDEMETHAFALVDKDGDVQLRKLPLSRLMEKSNGQELVKKALSRWTDSFQAEWLLINLALTTTGFKCAEVV
tara:strand:- start:416 stop:991 length:576 start_codon:yes stop_codon:yes gene_type:complete